MKQAIIIAAATLASTPVLAETFTGAIGVTRAVTIAENEANATALEAEADFEAGRAVYEVDLAGNGGDRRILIDAMTGDIVSSRKPSFGWAGWFGGKEGEKLQGVRLGALLASLEQETKGEVREVSFENEGGKIWYEVELAAPAGTAEVMIDPLTGNRLAFSHDD